jgi:hypothetical protein
MSILALASNTLIGTPASGNLEYDGQFFGTDSNASRAQMQRIVRATAVSASGTAITFSGIPVWAERITIMLSGISLSGTANLQIQIGSGSALTSGYVGQTWLGNTNNASYTSGFLLSATSLATYVYYGHATLTNITSNSWVFSAAAGVTTAGAAVTGGGSNTTLGGALDRVIITTSNGTDTFDAGSVNIIYEG